MSDAPTAPSATNTPATGPAAPTPAALATRLHEPAGPSEPTLPDSDTDAGQDWSAEVTRLRRENAGWRTKLRDTEARLAEREAAAQTDTERALATARSEAIAETTAKFNAKLIAAEVRGLAAELRFRDPVDAARLVDLAELEPGPDGDIDTATIGKALKAVADAKPYLIDTAPAAPTARDVGLGSAGGAPSTGYDTYSVADFDRELFGPQS